LDKFDFAANLQLRGIYDPVERAAVDKAQDEERKEPKIRWIVSLFCSTITPLICSFWVHGIWPLSFIPILSLIVDSIRDSDIDYLIRKGLGQPQL